MAGWLLDTNVILRSQQIDSSQYEMALQAISVVLETGQIVCIVPQVVIEFWCVATRPKDVNGLGWDSLTAEVRVAEFRARFQMLDDTPGVFDIWLDLVRTHAIKGKQVHDARLVAVMKAHGVENLLTFNVDDFKVYQEINAVHPASVVQRS